MNGIVLTALYVPGDRPDRFAKAAASGADVVILDLEDAVAPAAKEQAREAVGAWLSARAAGPDAHIPAVQIRVNPLGSAWGAGDAAMLGGLAYRVEVRVPKVRLTDDLDAWAELLPQLPLHAILESAAGVEAAAAIAAHPAVATIGLGEADLAADLGTSGEEALAWVRSRLVVAARATGLPAPMQSVYAHVTDLDGLAHSCERGRSMGLLGRAAIHPRQLPVIARAYRPSPDAVTRAREVLTAVQDAVASGRGVAVLPDGSMLDAAMVPAARRVLSLEQAAQRTLAAGGT